ncbi:DUF7697 family protein [Sphingomonas sp. LR55]|uniref:DUF7697 family protein n=1 Tax=Sphingomonas sp. LR55 TaxID=3050231 RepID=UPI002FDFEEF3
MWRVLTACDRQLRSGMMGAPVGLDFGAIMTMGTARKVDLGLLADVLPVIEPIIIDNLSGQEPDDFTE